MSLSGHPLYIYWIWPFLGIARVKALVIVCIKLMDQSTLNINIRAFCASQLGSLAA